MVAQSGAMEMSWRTMTGVVASRLCAKPANCAWPPKPGAVKPEAKAMPPISSVPVPTRVSERPLTRPVAASSTIAPGLTTPAPESVAEKVVLPARLVLVPAPPAVMPMKPICPVTAKSAAATVVLPERLNALSPKAALRSVKAVAEAVAVAARSSVTVRVVTWVALVALAPSSTVPAAVRSAKPATELAVRSANDVMAPSWIWPLMKRALSSGVLPSKLCSEPIAGPVLLRETTFQLAAPRAVFSSATREVAPTLEIVSAGVSKMSASTA